MEPTAYVPRTTPFEHQRAGFIKSARKRIFALLMEQGTGKTKLTIDTAAYLYLCQKIDALLVIAPNEVHAQWAHEQIPTHMPTNVRTRVVAWGPGSRRKRAAELIKPIRGTLPILCMNQEALATKEGFSVALRFLRAYRAPMAVVDESHYFSNPKAKRSRRLMQLRKHTYVRRILTGTPVSQSPFDAWSQFAFLDENVLGFDSFVTFRARYGVFTKGFCKITSGKKAGQLREFPVFEGYKNIEELSGRIARVSYRVEKADCLDLPEKMYMDRPCALSKRQREYFDALVNDGMLMIDTGNKTLRPPPEIPEELAEAMQQTKGRVTLKIKLVLFVRLQQILGGFITDDEGSLIALHDDPNDIPRVQALMDIVSGVQGKVIVWAQYRHEIAMIEKLFVAQFGRAAVGTMYGGMKRPERERVDRAFKDRSSSLRFLVSHPKSGGTGRDWPVANTMVYYSNGYSVRTRQQSEDRAHRIGLQGTLSIHDLMATEVKLDATIRDAHKSGIDLASVILKASKEELRRMAC